MSPRLREVTIPDFGLAAAAPVLPPELYAARLDRLRARAGQAGYDHIVVYADREHSANLAYLTGFDPRFEEAILLVAVDGGEPVVLVGNECVGLAKAAPLAMQVVLHQDLSLPNQPRDRSRPLDEELAAAGIEPGQRVGVVGWKTYTDPTVLEVPSFLADVLRERCDGQVDNAGGLLIDPGDGLRVINELEQLLYFEYAASQTSQGVRRLLEGLQPGMSERDAVQLLRWNGDPLSCHLMLSSGERAWLGLVSPTDRTIGHGEAFTVAYGLWGGLTCRAGFVAEDAAGLPTEIADYVDRLVAPYFAAIVAWYEALHVGQTGGVLADIVERHLGDEFFGIFLNAGHQLHLDEWVNSPIWAGSTIPLRSGMALQADVIPATGTPWFTTNIEDGIVLADAALRARFAAEQPGVWARIEARRRFVREVIGIDLHDDVLPLSNYPACLAPFLLRPHQIMTV